MIEKMKFVNLMGPISDIERVKEQYLVGCDIQIEDAVHELGKGAKVTSFAIQNSYTDALRKAEHFASLAGISCPDESYMSKAESLSVIEEINNLLQDKALKVSEIQAEKKAYEESQKQLSPFTELDFSIENLKKFNFVKYRFGRIPVNNFMQFETYMSDQEGILLEKALTDKDYVYCAYFAPATQIEKVDATFKTFHFEPSDISLDLKGTPTEASHALKQKIEKCDAEILTLEQEQGKLLETRTSDLAFALRKLKELSSYVDIQRYAAKTREEFYVMCGWMPEGEAVKLENRTLSDDKVVIVLEDAESEIKSTPPTKLRNLGLFRPFESLVKVYGTPMYNEIDPTVFLGITYCLLFGLMFGDLGQGLVLSGLGFWLFKKYKLALGQVLGIAGLFSAFFGLMYGSVFGYETLIPHIWLSPMHSINTILATTVGFGILLNLIAMTFHIINGVKRKDWGDVLFNPNGISGFVFYVAVLASALCAVTGYYQVSVVIAFIFIGLPLILIMFREPLANKLAKHDKLIHGKPSDFVLELFFETFEILLSYATNTISFIRVGAFALCHVGMMSVVLMLAGANEASLGNPIVMIIGNIFVMGMEGLVVGIQALRLQYYEMFSRYFISGGREFKSFKSQYKL